ncbi:MAG: nucleotide sugar dehydrogenase [Promethearchaeota archaeon]
MSEVSEKNLLTSEDWLDAINSKSVVVSVIGVGRIGLPTALMISQKGYQTYGIDINAELVEKINQGGGDPPIPFVLDEKGLPEALLKVTTNKKLYATIDFKEFVPKTDIIIICVPTPVNEQKVPEYNIIDNVIENLGTLNEQLSRKIIIVESTVGPKYVEKRAIPILEQRSGLQVNKDFWIASCPERANPGNIMENLITIPRIVGASNGFARKIVTSFYKKIFNVKIIEVSNPRTANSVKLIENIFRAVNIAFANEIAQLMRLLDIDYMEVLKGAASKYNFLPHFPGPGVGGPCLPSNPYYLINDGYGVSFTPNLVRVATEINQRQPSHIMELVFEGLNEIGLPIASTPIAILGISYKPNVKDVQISSIIPIIEHLKQSRAIVAIYDPFYVRETFMGIKTEPDYNFIKHNYPMIIIHTPHDEFLTPEFKDFLKECNNLKIIIDCHNVYNYKELPKKLYYIGVGRPLKYLK